MPRLPDNVAESVSRAVDGNVKLVHFFQKYDEANQKKQDEVEEKLEECIQKLEDAEKSPRMLPGEELQEIVSISYHEMINAFRAAKRAFSRPVREKLKKVIMMFDRLKSVKRKYQKPRGFKNLIMLFKVLYTSLIDKHIQLTAMIEDDLVLNIKRLSTQTATIFDDAMRGLIDSEEGVEGAKGIVEQATDKNAGKDPTDKLLDQYFSANTELV